MQPSYPRDVTPNRVVNLKNYPKGDALSRGEWFALEMAMSLRDRGIGHDTVLLMTILLQKAFTDEYLSARIGYGYYTDIHHRLILVFLCPKRKKQMRIMVEHHRKHNVLYFSSRIPSKRMIKFIMPDIPASLESLDQNINQFITFCGQHVAVFD